VLPDDLRGLVSESFGIQIEVCTPIVGAGDECLLWHVMAPRPLVVRAAPAWRSEAELRWAYGVAAALQAYVPEAVTPESPDILRWRGRAVTIWPYIPGRHLDRDRPDDRVAAARLLARLHQAALLIDDPGPRPPSADRPSSGRPQPSSSVPSRDLVDAELDSALASWRAGAGAIAHRGPVHGDFYRRNVLSRRDVLASGDRLALLDWDDTRVDALSVELAWSVWEFGHVGPALDMPRVLAFLDDYRRAGGPPYDLGMIVPFIRERLRWEVMRSRAAAAAGEYHDLGYEASEVCAFGRLRGVTLADHER
jgi:Ser/Thr protein kinase RdoA (MazF antagonist)